MDIQGQIGSRVVQVGACNHTATIGVTDTASEITLTDGKNTVEMMNTGSKTIYWGGSGVSSTTGFPLYRRQWHSWNCKKGWSIFVVCAGGETSTLRRVEYD